MANLLAFQPDVGARRDLLPVASMPDITPPTVKISTSYPGANAQVVEETVTSPIEQQVNGVENMIYMSSISSSDGPPPSGTSTQGTSSS